MSTDKDIEHWLRSQPLDEPIEIDGESVYLKRHAGGAELGVTLVANPVPAQLEKALKLGFRSAMQFDAGLALGSDGTSLVLSQWLPGVETWSQTIDALERLLNQLSMFREGMEAEPVRPGTRDDHRQEQRLRMHFAGERNENC